VHTRAASGSRSRGRAVLLVLAVIAVALNQRPAVVGVAPVLGDLRAGTGLSSALAGLLTALPVLCFGAFAPLAPRLARRIGLETAVSGSLVLLGGGMALRLLSPVALLYGGTLVAGAAIAVANVLMPAFVKREFARPGTVMGLYSASLNIGAAAAAGLTVPIGVALGVDWRVALASWLVLAGAALALWLPVAGRGSRDSAPPAAGPGAWSLVRVPLACQVTAFLGLQSVEFYSVGAWLPSLLADAGVPVGEGGLLLAASNVLGAAGALLAPAQAGRMRTQRPLVLVVLLAYVGGLSGLLVAPSAGTLLWVALFGFAQGSGFALALTLTVLRSATPLVAAQLGGVAQCLGYLMAATGPVALGALHDLTGTWSWPLALLLALLLPMAWAGWGAARNAVLGGASTPAAQPAPAGSS
jgi:CP family cyanate transporter-like MFS transporter